MSKFNLNLNRELELLEEELIENENIYNQIKKHFDSTMKNQYSQSKFVAEQTTNLMNIRNSRLNIIKEMIGVKKSQVDIQIKDYTATKAEQGENGSNQALAKEIYNLLKNDTREGSIEKILETANNIETVNNDNNTMDDDALLEERIKKIREKKEKENQEAKKEIPHIFACDNNKNIYALSLDGSTILDGIELPKMDIEFETDPISGEITARDTISGEEVVLIEIE